MPTYRVVENPSPFTEGQSTETIIENNNLILTNRYFDNTLVTIPAYTIIQRQPNPINRTTVNSTVINQTINITGGGIQVGATYVNFGTQSGITSKTPLINDGSGGATFDDNTAPVWDTSTNEIVPNVLKEVLDIQLRLRLTTDTLGGSFEISAETGSSNVIDTIEESINIQDQDYTVRFRIITTQDAIDNRIKLYIAPELGMTLNVLEFELVVIKG